MTNSADLIFSNGTVVTMNASYDLHLRGAVAVKGNRIIAVGDSDEITATYAAAEIVDCHQQAILPGLVNAHTHIPMSLMRGLHDDLRLDVWLGYLMPLEREFVTPEFVRLGARLACAEMIRSGITCFADMYYYEDSVAEETAAIGMRALLGQTLLIFPAPDAETFEDGLIHCRRFIEKWNGHELIQPAVAPHAWYTATPQLLRASADLARAYDVPLHTHVSETKLEVQNSHEQHHMPVVSWLEKNGILETKLLAAHCVWLEPDEMYSLQQAGAGIAHCPASNLKLASGIAQVSTMLELGLNVGVGTDGPASNNDLDMFEELRLAALLAKMASNDPTVVPARQALALATIGGARAMHMGDRIGSLEVGKLADIAVLEMSGVHSLPQFKHNPEAIYSQIAYAANSRDVRHVVCHGRWLMRERELLTVDEAGAKRDAAVVAAQIDEFVARRESSPYNKLVLLKGVQRQQSFEVQVKAPLADDRIVHEVLESEEISIERHTHYLQYDHYFVFDGQYPDAARLRYREDVAVSAAGEVEQSRTRLTLIGEEERVDFANAATLSRSRFLAAADRSLRFYQEYFAAPVEITVSKERLRWHILYRETDFAINLDKLSQPELPGHYLEIKSRTWSRSDAERKAHLIGELLMLFQVDPGTAERREYPDLVLAERDS